MELSAKHSCSLGTKLGSTVQCVCVYVRVCVRACVCMHVQVVEETVWKDFLPKGEDHGHWSSHICRKPTGACNVLGSQNQTRWRVMIQNL